MIQLLKKCLLKLVDDIDAGNTEITENDALQICGLVNELIHKDERMSKYKAYSYLNISRATFDNYVAQGLLPKGKKEAGYKELSWYKKDLDKFIKDRKQDKK